MTEAMPRNSAITRARTVKTVPGRTGRFSRQSRPRPSRHQALTPKSSAPPDTTSPGRIVIDSHGRPPTTATSPGPTASTAMPRRIGTARQTEARSIRSKAERSLHGIGRGVWVSVSARSSSCGSRRAAKVAGMEPSTTRHTRSTASSTIALTQPHVNPPIPATHSHRVGIWSSTSVVRPVIWTQNAAAARPTSRNRIATMPCGRRRTASTIQAITWAAAVANAEPEQGHGLGREEPRRQRAVRRGAQQHPRLDQPRDVEGREQQRAEVVGGRADREGDALLAADQLAAAAGGDRRDDRDREDAGHGGRHEHRHLQPPFVVGRHERRDGRGSDRDEQHDQRRPAERRAAADRGGPEAQQVADVADRPEPEELGGDAAPERQSRRAR